MKIQNKLIQGWMMLVAIAFTSSISPAHASAKPVIAPVSVFPAALPALTAAVYDKGIHDAQARGIASVKKAKVDITIDDAFLSDDFLTLRSRLLGGPTYKNGKGVDPQFQAAKTADDLAAILKDINQDIYYTNPNIGNDAKFAAAQIAPLVVFRGFFNRTMDWVKPTNVSHMAVVSALRTLGSAVVTYFPGEQSVAGLMYLTQPSDDMGFLINNEEDMHKFLETQLLPTIVKMSQRINDLKFGDKPVYFDNKVFYGSANFKNEDSRYRYVRMGEPERNALLSSIFYTISSVESLDSYNLNGFFAVIDALAKDYGYGSYFKFNPDESSAPKRHATIKAIHDQYAFLVQRDGGAKMMNEAYKSMTYAVSYANNCWAELQKSGTSSNGNLLDARSIGPINDMMVRGLQNLRYVATGNTANGDQLSSLVVQTEGRKIDLYNFYSKSPHDLFDLMPSDFDHEKYDPPAMMVTINGVKTPREWHNFLSGRPNTWNIPEYKKLFPDVNSNDDVPATARILSQAWGGWLLGVPLSALVL